MSHPEFSSACSNPTKELCVDKNTGNCGTDSADKSPECGRNDQSSVDKCARDRVLKEVGITSTAFIGPAFPPQTPTAKSDIEDTLSEFYKELEKIDAPDEDNGNLGTRVRPVLHPETPAGKATQDEPEEKITSTRNSTETDSYHKKTSTGSTQCSWPHWYRNEPYHVKKQRPGMSFSNSVSDQTHWHYPHPVKGPPHPRFHRPLPHQPQYAEFPNPQSVAPNVHLSFKSPGTTNQYQNEYNFLPFGSFRPPNICSGPSQGFYTNLPHHFDRDDQVCSYDTHSDSAAAGWSRDHCDEVYDGPQRFDSENEWWEQPRQYKLHSETPQSASVLILMRGLPGSGKTTLARELLSTGPSGVILSTDDYFAHKDGYRYDPGLLGSAHEWNQSRAKDALHKGRSPVIIDNTNLQAWEMKPYVRMALDRGYQVDFCEPDTSWKFDPYELEKRNKHGVPQDKIAQMMDRFSFPISIDIVMSSHEPHHVMQRHRPEQLQMRQRRDFH